MFKALKDNKIIGVNVGRRMVADYSPKTFEE